MAQVTVLEKGVEIEERDLAGNRQLWFRKEQDGSYTRLLGDLYGDSSFCPYCGSNDCVAVTHGESVCG
jgi:hypothetical protein